MEHYLIVMIQISNLNGSIDDDLDCDGIINSDDDDDDDAMEHPQLTQMEQHY